MHLQIDPHGEVPLCRQIQLQIGRAIADREIHPGDLLESQEDLAVQLAVSPSAVRKAYRELKSDGLCDEAHGGHHRVTTPDLGSSQGSNTGLALSLLRTEFLNQELLPFLTNREFVALAYARFDPRDGTLEIANAGLPDPYLLRHSGLVETLPVAGDRLPLGVRQEIAYSTLKITIDSANRLLLVTDGTPEAGNPVGYEGLARLLDSSADRESDPTTGDCGLWLDRFLDQVSGRTGSILDDDWTAVLLEYHRS